MKAKEYIFLFELKVKSIYVLKITHMYQYIFFILIRLFVFFINFDSHHIF